MNKEKAVVVFSGGQDSTTCLFWALKKYKEVIAVSFDYNQKHILELDCAKNICKKHGIEYHVFRLKPIKPTSTKFINKKRYGS